MITKKILKKIKKYDNIVIARHIGADPDALGSSIGLKEIIKLNFPRKNVFVIGNPAGRFKFFGELDKVPEDTSGMLLIVTDTPDSKRIDGAKCENFADVIKIDHHPFIEKYASIEWYDDTYSSASQMIIELVRDNRLKIDEVAASKLFMGVIADTGRFLYNYTNAKTFELVTWLIKKTNIDFVSLYPNLYMKNFNDVVFSAYITSNLVITDNKLAYIKLDNAILKKYKVDASTAGNLITDFNLINEILVVALFSEDVANGYIKCSVRSRGPVVNEVASNYNGGGHVLASGAKLKDFDMVDCMINELDSVCFDYLN